MPTIEVYGNQLENIEIGGTPPLVAGYRIHTGPPGTEGDEASVCRDSRVLEFLKSKFTNLQKRAYGVCESTGWDAWLLTYEASDEPVDTDKSDADRYPESQRPPTPDPLATSSAEQKPVGAQNAKRKK